MDRGAVARRLNEISTELAKAHLILGDLQAIELDNKVNVFKDLKTQQNNSQTGIDKLAVVHMHGQSRKILKLRGEIAALQEERDNLRFLVKWNLEGEV